MKAVFIGSDPAAIELITKSLMSRWADASLLASNSAEDGLESVKRESPDVVVMHDDFTDMSLAQAIKELREFTNVPLLVLGIQGSRMEVITALEMGADDCVQMPCDATEMMVRVWAMLRRKGVNI